MDKSSSQFAWPFPGLLILVATMPVVMVAAAGERRHLVDLPATPPSADGGGGVSSSDYAKANVSLLVVCFLFTLYVSCYIRHKIGRHAVEQRTAGRDNNGRARQSSNRGEAPPRSLPQQQQRPAVVAPPPPPAVDVELALALAPAPAPVLDCTFRTADGWEETMCSVCQSEMADGEKVRVLTECMYRFHTACVKKWLRDHATCPLCRAPTAATAAKGHQHRPTT